MLYENILYSTHQLLLHDSSQSNDMARFETHSPCVQTRAWQPQPYSQFTILAIRKLQILFQLHKLIIFSNIFGNTQPQTQSAHVATQRLSSPDLDLVSAAYKNTKHKNHVNFSFSFLSIQYTNIEKLQLNTYIFSFYCIDCGL